jgi:predicted LPLAT superfamily acyltransferase
LRSVAERTGVTLNVLIFSANAERINDFFEKLHPGLRMRMIPFEPGKVRWVFDVKAAIDRGELVALMGDRLWESERDREVAVTFLGRRARFPLGPFLLQTMIGCPMILTGCVRTGTGALPRVGDAVRTGRCRPAQRPAQVRRGARPALCARARAVVPARAVSVVQLLRLLA